MTATQATRLHRLFVNYTVLRPWYHCKNIFLTLQVLTNPGSLKIEPILSGLAFKNAVQTVDLSGAKLSFLMRSVPHNDFVEFLKRTTSLRALSVGRTGILIEVLLDLLVRAVWLFFLISFPRTTFQRDWRSWKIAEYSYTRWRRCFRSGFRIGLH